MSLNNAREKISAKEAAAESAAQKQQSDSAELAAMENGEGSFIDDTFEKSWVQNHLKFHPFFWFFPGVVAHELAHAVAVWITGGHVTKIKWWDINKSYINFKYRVRGNLSFTTPLLASVAPLSLFLFSYYLISLSFQAFYNQSTDGIIWPILLFWLGLSLAIMAFPSTQDLKHGIRASQKMRRPFQTFTSFLISAITFIPLIFLEAVLWALMLLFKDRSSLRILMGIVFVMFVSNYFGYAI